MNPFDYVNSILQNKNNLIVDEQTEKEYVPFLTNRSLSYHKDCVFFANEMNIRHFVDKKMQYDFLLNTVRAKKRYNSKWTKGTVNDDIKCIKEVYCFSDSKATEVYNLFTKEQLNVLKEKINKGGLQK